VDVALTEQLRGDELDAEEAELRRIIAANPNAHGAYQKLGLIHQQRWLAEQAATATDEKQSTESDIPARERQMNQATRNCWELFVTHRRRVTSLLTDDSHEQSGELLIVGAGNCNDLELSALLEAYSRVHLVDIDATAMEAGTSFQNVSEPQTGLVLHRGVDVTGIADQMSGWIAGGPPDAEELAECISRVHAAEIALPQGVDVAVSMCLLSQLMMAMNTALGDEHPQFRNLASAVRIRHLLHLVGSVRPGGRVLIVTDLTSTDTYPELFSTSQRELPELLERIMAEDRFLTGVNPFHLQRLCHEVPELARRVAEVRVSRPWTWYFPGRTHVVCAVELMCSSG
jgi:hypothetical protein